MAENGIIYVAFYAELYILISIVLLLKTKVDLCNPAFIFWSAYTVLLGLGPVVYGFYRSNFVFVYNYYLVILAPFDYCSAFATPFHAPLLQRSMADCHTLTI